jgi:hypothetical protein
MSADSRDRRHGTAAPSPKRGIVTTSYGPPLTNEAYSTARNAASIQVPRSQGRSDKYYPDTAASGHKRRQDAHSAVGGQYSNQPLTNTATRRDSTSRDQDLDDHRGYPGRRSGYTLSGHSGPIEEDSWDSGSDVSRRFGAKAGKGSTLDRHTSDSQSRYPPGLSRNSHLAQQSQRHERSNKNATIVKSSSHSYGVTGHKPASAKDRPYHAKGPARHDSDHGSTAGRTERRQSTHDKQPERGLTTRRRQPDEKAISDSDSSESELANRSRKEASHKSSGRHTSDAKSRDQRAATGRPEVRQSATSNRHAVKVQDDDSVSSGGSVRGTFGASGRRKSSPSRGNNSALMGESAHALSRQRTHPGHPPVSSKAYAVPSQASRAGIPQKANEARARDKTSARGRHDHSDDDRLPKKQSVARGLSPPSKARHRRPSKYSESESDAETDSDSHVGRGPSRHHGRRESHSVVVPRGSAQDQHRSPAHDANRSSTKDRDIRSLGERVQRGLLLRKPKPPRHGPDDDDDDDVRGGFGRRHRPDDDDDDDVRGGFGSRSIRPS